MNEGTSLAPRFSGMHVEDLVGITFISPLLVHVGLAALGSPTLFGWSCFYCFQDWSYLTLLFKPPQKTALFSLLFPGSEREPNTFG